MALNCQLGNRWLSLTKQLKQKPQNENLSQLTEELTDSYFLTDSTDLNTL